MRRTHRSSTVLQRAAEFFEEDPSRRCRGAYARDEKGASLDDVYNDRTDLDKGVSFCVLGACAKFGGFGPKLDACENFIQRVLDSPFFAWADAENTSTGEVVDILNAAAELAKAEGL